MVKQALVALLSLGVALGLAFLTGALFPTPGAAPAAHVPSTPLPAPTAPEAAVRTFLRAAEAKDIHLLSQCFAAACAEAFKSVREKTATPQELDVLKDMATGATLAGTRDATPASATVDLKTRDGATEDFQLVKEGDAWKVKDF
jgi:hypothetical protein